MPTSPNRAVRSGFAGPRRPRSRPTPVRVLGCMLSFVLGPGGDESRPGESERPGGSVRGPAGLEPDGQPGRRHAAQADRSPRSPPCTPRPPGSSRSINPPMPERRPPGRPSDHARPSPAPATTPAESAADKQLRELFQERLQLLEEYEKASASLKKAMQSRTQPRAANGRCEGGPAAEAGPAGAGGDASRRPVAAVVRDAEVRRQSGGRAPR